MRILVQVADDLTGIGNSRFLKFFIFGYCSFWNGAEFFIFKSISELYITKVGEDAAIDTLFTQLLDEVVKETRYMQELLEVQVEETKNSY
jgi:hypothetical protein